MLVALIILSSNTFMYNFYQSTIISTIAISILACGLNTIQKDRDFDRFPIEKELKEQNFFQITNCSPEGLLLYKDSLLIVRNATNTSNYHFSIFDLQKKSFISSFLPSGRKSAQSLGFLSYGIKGNRLWVHDIIKDNLIITPLYGTDSVLEARIPFYYSIQLSNNSEFVGSGDYDSDYKISVLDVLTGQIKRQLLPYSSDSTTVWTRSQKMAYESFLFLQPSGKKCVTACRYADQIEILDISTGQSRIIKGPESYEPDVMEMKGNDGKMLSTRNADTRFAFVTGKVTDRYIYLLYSGNNHNSAHFTYGKFIYVYDWEGKPVEKILLKDYAGDFVVTPDDSHIYTYDPKSKFIKVGSLTNEKK